MHLSAIRDFVQKAQRRFAAVAGKHLPGLPHAPWQPDDGGCGTRGGGLAPLNDLIAILHTAGLPADAAVIAATGETAAVVARVVEQLNESVPSSPGNPRN